MNCLITSTVGLFYCQENKHELLTKKICSGYFFGLTWDEERIYAFKNVEPSTKIIIFNKKLRIIEEKDYNDIIHVHQAFYNPYTNRIYVCNTGKDKVDIINPYNLEIENNICLRKKNEDTLHVNSVFCSQDKIYICLHNRWSKTHKPSEIRIIDKNLNTLESFSIGKGCHNIYVSRKHIYVCSSEESKILVYNLDKKKVIESVSTPRNKQVSYNRGMCKTTNGFVITSSKRMIRGRRKEETSGMISFYSNDLKMVYEKEIYNIGQIADIRLIDDIDFCHNQILLGIK